MDEISQGGGQPQSLPAVVGNLGVLAAGTATLSHSHVVEDIAGIDIEFLASVLDRDEAAVERTWFLEFPSNNAEPTYRRYPLELEGVEAMGAPSWLVVGEDGAVSVAADGMYACDYAQEAVVEGVAGTVLSDYYVTFTLYWPGGGSTATKVEYGTKSSNRKPATVDGAWGAAPTHTAEVMAAGSATPMAAASPYVYSSDTAFGGEVWRPSEGSVRITEHLTIKRIH